MLRDPDLVLLHVGDRAEYDRGHLPGARYVALSDISVSDHSGAELHLEMPPADVLKGHLEALGIGDRSRIVVYYGNDWMSPATRVMFTLDYAGLGDRTALLDGGQPAWVRAGQRVTAEVAPVRAGSLSSLRLRPIVVDAAFVRAHLDTPGYAIVDGRAASFYDGIETGQSMDRAHRTGHIRGAHNVPFTEIADDRMVFKPAAALEQLFAKAGVRAGDTVIGYCHIGQQATAMLFAARTLGHPVLLYDGSFEDWSRQDDAPVENPSRK
jgi:thiosulfate/3-mercaptopyruvate sulfurtransferase